MSKRSGKQTEYARFKRAMARLEARLEKQRHEETQKQSTTNKGESRG